MEVFWVYSEWMTERLHVTTNQEVERLDLLIVFLVSIQFFKSVHHCGTAEGNTSDSRPVLKSQRFRWVP